MITIFLYKCRWCGEVTQDPGQEFDINSMAEAEMILRDSIFRNPIAKKRTEIYITHVCDTETQSFGVCDLVGYKLVKDEGIKQSPAKILSIVKD
jgi:hypothetical protein